jgi:hypothetical protein
MAPAILPGRRPRVLTAIDTAALAAVANAVRHARQAESSALRPEPAQVSADPASRALQSLRSCVSDEEEALA